MNMSLRLAKIKGLYSERHCMLRFLCWPKWKLKATARALCNLLETLGLWHSPFFFFFYLHVSGELCLLSYFCWNAAAFSCVYGCYTRLRLVAATCLCPGKFLTCAFFIHSTDEWRIPAPVPVPYSILGCIIATWLPRFPRRALQTCGLFNCQPEVITSGRKKTLPAKYPAT